MANGKITVGHKKFLLFASSVDSGYAGKPTNKAMRKIQRDLNEVGMQVRNYRWMNVHNTLWFWLATSRNPVQPMMHYRVALQRLTKGVIKVDDWEKQVDVIDSSPWIPGQM